MCSVLVRSLSLSLSGHFGISLGNGNIAFFSLPVRLHGQTCVQKGSSKPPPSKPLGFTNLILLSQKIVGEDEDPAYSVFM